MSTIRAPYEIFTDLSGRPHLGEGAPTPHVFKIPTNAEYSAPIACAAIDLQTSADFLGGRVSLCNWPVGEEPVPFRRDPA